MNSSQPGPVTTPRGGRRSRRTLLQTGFALASAVFGITSTQVHVRAQDENPDGVPRDAERAEVTGHIDGDKFEVKIGGKTETVLLISADAPEPDECFGKESGDQLKKLLPMKSVVYLEKDTTDRDGKDRLLRYAWAVDEDDKARLIDERMIANGFSTFKAREDNNRRDDRLKKAQETAKSKKRGIWADGSCGGGHEDIKPTPQLGEGDLPADPGTPLITDGQEITVADPFFTYDLNFSTPKGGYVFLVVYVTIKNVDDPGKTHGYEESRFSAKDLDTGANFDDTFAFADQPLGFGELSPGEFVSGQVVLEVQDTATRIRVKYDPKSLGSGDEVYWLVHR
jgi:endonuclease YncB( thermonuclease family)